MLSATADFVREHPIATKRVLRAILKATDLCATEPERAAQTAGRWRVHDALRLRAPDADRAPLRPAGASSTPRTRCASIALRLHEVGMIKSSPNAILAEGTDWRFLNELKRELKA